MLSLVLPCLFFGLAALLLLWAAWCDWQKMHIANRISEALLGVFVLGALTPAAVFPGISLLSGLIAGGIVLAVTLLLYTLRAMGGGDTKLATATATLVGLNHLGLFLVIMTMTGGILGLYALAVRKAPKLLPESLIPETNSQAWLSQLKSGAGKVPYGVAIAMGGIVTLFLKWVSPFLLS